MQTCSFPREYELCVKMIRWWNYFCLLSICHICLQGVWLLEGEEIVADGERVIITEEEDEDGMGIVTTLRITKVSSFTKVSIKGTTLQSKMNAKLSKERF